MNCDGTTCLTDFSRARTFREQEVLTSTVRNRRRYKNRKNAQKGLEMRAQHVLLSRSNDKPQHKGQTITPPKRKEFTTEQNRMGESFRQMIYLVFRFGWQPNDGRRCCCEGEHLQHIMAADTRVRWIGERVSEPHS